ncbi:MAG: histone deacetylase family protein [Actinomycetales bacterium]|nr:histone deacetylase family protein [Actinomycetales bacterium]
MSSSSPPLVFWSPQTRLHDPRHEVWVGVATEGTEVPARVDAILSRLGEFPCHEVTGGEGLAAAGVVHSPELLGHLRSASEEWQSGPYRDLVGQERVVPYLFPTPAMTGRMPQHVPTAVHARAGAFAYDTMTLLGPGSWSAIEAAADCAWSAADAVAAGRTRSAYALCRPPGHHATTAGYGGSCYVNNAALAAQVLRDRGVGRVAVIDLDAHHGNGTQEIFWSRADVLYGSVHVDPGAGWFPHYVGFADETGADEGLGCTLNLPLAEGTADPTWLAGVERLGEWVTAAGCAALVVSLGVDAAVDDPESPLQITTGGYAAAGALLGGLGLPTVLVQEGGYHLPTLGDLVAAHLGGYS